ncbi:unnamed protein product [Rotaria sp. Silwood2]|nr:unnamed protein product [Rotaria sp. Silwood2]
MTRGLKFARLLQRLERCSESIMYHDEINSVVQQIKQMESIMMPLQFHPIQVFDETKHTADTVAKEYLQKATEDTHHLVPVNVLGDGNCLYQSIVVLMNNPLVTASELRVRTIMELITNENYYQNTYSQYVGPTDIAVKAICKNYMFSELYEIAALCNVLQCNIRSVYPKIDFHHYMAIWDNLFTPIPPVNSNCNIAILWSNVLNEKDVRETHNGMWRPNHFVPLMSLPIRNEFNNTSQSALLVVKTFKNNTVTQIRTPRFQSSPSRRLRSEDNIGNDFTQSFISGSMQKEKNDKEERRQIQLQKKRERSRSSRMNETEEQRQIRLEKERERSRSSRMNETEEQRQIRLEKERERSRSSRTNETEKQREIRLEKKKEQTQSTRTNELEEQRQIRLEQQKKRSQVNRTKKKVEKPNNENISTGQNFSHSNWPGPISRDLKDTRLQQFLEQMSMSKLAEATCAVCNIRTSAKDAKKIPISKIPNIELLKVSEELKSLIRNSTENTSIFNGNDNNGQTTAHIKNHSASNSSSFYCQNDIFLYKNGLFQTNRVNMCVICQKCHSSLSKEHIPKFSAANNMWLGDIPTELQGLTIPEEKLISLYRHNSCIIKLQSPFHSATTAQTALKGHCITFLQNVPNIVNSLPLTLADLCDTLKVIFIGARPPDRLHLKKVLTVRKKKIVQALQWLKKYNILYQNINISLENIAQLPEDDVPECIMSTLEQKIGDEEGQSERTGYVPDPLMNPKECTTADVIPISNSGVLDANGSSVSSDEIVNYFLHKIKTNDQEVTENVYLIPHSSKPVNEYFNPKLLTGLYPTLFCYGRGAPEDQSRPIEIKFKEHIRYLLSYNDRRFETNHSFIFVVFNLLQRRDACFHAQLIATKPYFQASANEIQSINSKDIEMALNNNSKRTYNTEANSALNKLLRHIKTVGGRVMGSAYSRTALRTRIHALIFNQGLPSIFPTLNPADIHSPVALYFAGVQLNLDKIQNEQLMDTYRRAEIVASHPVATAKFFHVLISNILDTMIMGGVLGPVKAYFGTVESQGRGSLHLHLLIWLDHDMKPADMKEKIQDATFRNKLKAYLEDIIKEDLDNFKDKQVIESSNGLESLNTSTQLSQNNIYTALRTIDLTGFTENTHQSPTLSTPTKQHLSSLSIPYKSPSILFGSPSIPYRSPVSSPLVQTPTHNGTAFDMNVLSNQSNLPPACLPTPNPSSPNFESRFCAHVVQVVESGNTHRHSDTCYKYCNGACGDKKICRLRMPRKLVPVSTIDPETGHISMKRSDPWINNFNEYIISACRSNMDIKFIWTGNDAKALVYYITDYVTKMSLSFHDTFSLVQKSITSLKNPNNQVDQENVIEKSRKLVLRCYNALASQQELSGVQVASYLMNWDDHYTTHKFQGLYLIQTERFLQSELNEIRAKQNLQSTSQDVIDDEDIFDDETINEENNDEEHFQVQPAGDKNNFILVNTRVDYQYRSNNLNNTCLYDFVSTFYKKKINEIDIKYLSKSSTTEKRQDNQKGRPSNERFFFQKDHPQATTHLLMKYSEAHVPVLYGSQIPRQDRDDTRERYNRALLTLFVPWRNVIDLCDINQTWEDAFESRKHCISTHSWKIIENIQLLHECKKDRDEHLLQVIAEAQVDNDSIDPAFLPSNQGADGEYEVDDIDDFIQLIGSVDEFTAAAINATKKSTENVYIRETIEAVEKVGRFNHMNRHDQHVSNTGIDRQIVPFVSATPNLIKLNSKWQDQLKNEKERIRRSLISGKHNNDDDILDFNDVTDAVVTVVNPYDNRNNVEKNTSIPPVLVVKNNFSTQSSIIDEFTLNKEQRATFLIITSHLDGDNRFRTGIFVK